MRRRRLRARVARTTRALVAAGVPEADAAEFGASFLAFWQDPDDGPRGDRVIAVLKAILGRRGFATFVEDIRRRLYFVTPVNGVGPTPSLN